MEISETRAELFKALYKFRVNLKQPLKDANNPFFKSKYVPLENVVSVVDDAIVDTGLGWMQEIEANRVTTIITHESGEYMIVGGANVKPVKQDPQGEGSAITYAKRYSLSAAFGIASDPDDDGNAGSGMSNKPVKNQNNFKNQAKNTNTTNPLNAKRDVLISKAVTEWGATETDKNKWFSMEPQEAINQMTAFVMAKKGAADA